MDLIERQAAIDAIEKLILPQTKGETAAEEINRIAWRCAVNCAVEMVGHLPAAFRWIPVTKRLPKDLEEVNVTWVNHAPEQYYDFVKDKHFSGSAVYYKGSWYWYSSTCVDILAEYGRNEMDKIDDGIEVVAWMPLPESWEGEEDAKIH